MSKAKNVKATNRLSERDIADLRAAAARITLDDLAGDLVPLSSAMGKVKRVRRAARKGGRR
jgi:hypothetical protein